MRPRGSESQKISATSEVAQGAPYLSPAAAAEPVGGTSGWRTLIRAESQSSLIWIIPFGIAAVYLVVFLARFHHIIRGLGWVSDYASGFTVPETVVQTGTGGHALLASSGQWVSLWFGLLTANLPLHRELWSVAPTALFIFSALIIGWSVAKIATRQVAILAVLLTLVAAPRALAFFMAAVAHNALYPCTALTGAYLVWLALRQERRSIITFVAPVLMGLVLGVCAASDLLVVPTALAPLLLTAVLSGLRRDSHSRIVALSALASAVVAVPIAKLTPTIMRSSGFVTIPGPYKVATLADLSEHARLLFTGLKYLFNGNLDQLAPGILPSALGLVCTVLMVAALLLLCGFGALTVVRLLRSGWRKQTAGTSRELARSLHIIYWASSAVAVCLVFWLTAETGTSDAHESYYGTVIFSIAAVIPLLIANRLVVRRLVIAGASIFFIASLVGLTRDYTVFRPSVESYEAAIVRIARAHGATYGYAGYWNASSLTWSSDNRVTVRPLMACENPVGVGACPFYMERVPSWYIPKERKTFLLVDSTESWLPSLPAGFGRPVAGYAFGPIKMYIYPYDIASLLGPPLT